MKGRGITPLTQIARRPPEAGRLRMGHKVLTAKGKSRPAAIDTWRFTSENQAIIEQAAATFGGEARRWSDPKASPPNQWEVVTPASSIEVLVVPDSFSTWYEMWDGSGRARQCDGVTVDMPQRVGDQDYEVVQLPCICDRNGVLECRVTTRLQVVLPQLAFRGVWRLESKGWNAAEELPGMVDLLVQAAGSGRLIRAMLSIQKRHTVVAGLTRDFVVPHLALVQSYDELVALGPGRPAAALAGANVPALGAGDVLEVVDAEMIDDELLALEASVRADGRNFGLDPEAYLAAVKHAANGERARIAECVRRVRAGELEPKAVRVDGSIDWKVN